MVTKRKNDPIRKRERPVSEYDVAAVVGNDDRELERDGIAHGRIAGLEGVALPDRVRRNATPEQVRTLVEIVKLTQLHRGILEQIDVRVADARRERLSWETIGWVTGLSSAGARKRWGSE